MSCHSFPLLLFTYGDGVFSAPYSLDHMLRCYTPAMVCFKGSVMSYSHAMCCNNANRYLTQPDHQCHLVLFMTLGKLP